MIPFVCNVIGGDADEGLDHIILRKEAERSTGIGKHADEFWWGLGAALGPDVEATATQNGGTLPALFSRSGNAQMPHSNQIRIWNGWRSVLNPQQHGRIPDHVIVTSGYNQNPKNKRSDGHYALICHSGVKLALGNHGFCDLTQCQTAKNGKAISYLIGARLLVKSQPPLITSLGIASPSVRAIAFEASLVRHCYVKLTDPRVLSQTALGRLRQYSFGDNWLDLAKSLR
jgi:hypothetical protein